MTTNIGTISDTQSAPIGLSLQGDNPNSLTIVSAEWQISAGELTPATDTLTASVVGEPGMDGDLTVTAVATLSDGSTLTGQGVVTVTASSSPLTLVLVLGTPTGGS